MKVGIITIHVGTNFGSVLQTIATFDLIKSLGFAPEIIDYQPERVLFRRYLRDAFTSIRRLAWRCVLLPTYLANRHIFRGYLEKYVTLSRTITPKDNFQSTCPKYDYYVTGSDQVWNSIHNEGFDGRYYFEGLPEHSVKIAFASSIGRENFDEAEKPEVKELLDGYKAISVREDSAVKILSNLGIDSVQLLDPTFLLDRFQWKAYMSNRIVKEPYMLIYTPYNTVDVDVIYRSARRIADKCNLKVVTFSFDFQSEKRADRTIKYADPGDFLSLMYYADFVITNSFHGTAFSINLNKQFFVFQPSAFSTRIESILRKTKLLDRMMLTELAHNDIHEIDYTPVNKILDIEREVAKDFLIKALS